MMVDHGEMVVDEHKVPPGVRWVPQTAFSGVKFMHADATVEDKLWYTHIYIVSATIFRPRSYPASLAHMPKCWRRLAAV